MTNKIEDIFNKTFSYWGISLPPDAIENRQRGRCTSRRQVEVRYLFGEDEKGLYLDYYARHRICGDSHIRIYTDGTTKEFSTSLTYRKSSEDPDEDAQLEAEYTKLSAEIEEMLRKKGF